MTMSMRPLILTALLPAALLAGCAADNRGVESVHQPVVARTDYSLDVQTAPSGLAPGEGQRLTGWLSTLRVGYGDTIAIDDPYASGAAARGEVAAVAARFGLLLADTAPVTGAQVAAGTVRVLVSRASASVPGCPDHSPAYAPNFNARTSTNYGCAINTNLAAMIANPNDLVRGAAGTAGEYDAQSGTRAISTLRSAPPTGEGGGWLKSKAETTGGSK
jgi:pilus assembly protein CpaD